MEKPTPPKMRRIIKGLFIYEDVSDKTDEEIQKIIKNHNIWLGTGLTLYFILWVYIGTLIGRI